MKFVFRLTARFVKASARILSEDDLLELEIFLALNPEAGAVIKGGEGLRKVRFAAKGHGKRGGARVIYLRVVDPATIVLADCYAKSDKENLSDPDIKKLIAEIE